MIFRHNGIRTHLIILKIINYRLEYVFRSNGLFPFVNVKINPRNYSIYYKIRDNIVDRIIFKQSAKVILSYFFLFLYFLWFFLMVNIRKIRAKIYKSLR